MADAGDIPGTALKAARKATSSADTPKGLAAAGAALIALPYAVQGIAKLTGRDPAGAVGDKATELGEAAKQKATSKAKEVVGEVADEKLKPSMPKGLGSLLGGGGLFGGGDSDSDDSDSDEDGRDSAAPGHGSGRRMPIQQSIDVAAPIKVTYNLWTQFEEWPSFMHRVDQVQQVDDATVSFTTKVWGINKRFEAEIVEQRPDERIEWDVSQGLAHSGVVTFHELAPRLTRIEVTLDVNPDSLLEKMGRGMRFTKRAVRGDLHRFKAYAEMQEEDEGGWRGTIEDGEVKSKTERKSSRAKSSRSNGRSSRRSSGRSRNGSGPSSRSRSKSGARS
jgi:uncharacterized membrane protein